MRWTIWLRISSAFGANDDLALIQIKAGTGDVLCC